MIKFYEISQIEKTDVPNGTVKAAETGTKNYFVGAVANGVVTKAPTNGVGMKLFAGHGEGDNLDTECVVEAGKLMTAHDIKAQVGKCLQVSPESISYGSSESYASIVEGTTKMKPNAEGNLAIVASTSAGDLYFKVVKKINFGGAGVLVEVVQG